MLRMPPSHIRLNEDVLRNIFIEHAAVCDAPCRFPAVSAVCREWRQLSFVTPDLWNRFCACSLLPSNHGNFRLAAARDRPLDICFSVHSNGLAVALKLASDQIALTNSFTITIGERDLEMYELFPITAEKDYFRIVEAIMASSSQMMTELSVNWDVRDDTNCAPSICFHTFRMPNMRRMSLSGITFSGRGSSSLTSLTVLRLTKVRPSLGTTYADTLDILGNCASLDALLLDSCVGWPLEPPPTRVLFRSLTSIVVRDDMNKVASFFQNIYCPKLVNIRLWLTTGWSECEWSGGHAVALLFRTHPLFYARLSTCMAVVFNQSDHFSVAWSTEHTLRCQPDWSGLHPDNIRPDSLDAEFDNLLRGSPIYSVAVHVVADGHPVVVHSPGVLGAEHVIRQFILSHRDPLRLQVFCARGLAFVLAEYMVGLRAKYVYIDQMQSPLYDWLSSLPSDTLSDTVILHIARAIFSDDAAKTLEDMQTATSTQVIFEDCIRRQPFGTVVFRSKHMARPDNTLRGPTTGVYATPERPLAHPHLMSNDGYIYLGI